MLGTGLDLLDDIQLRLYAYTGLGCICLRKVLKYLIAAQKFPGQKAGKSFINFSTSSDPNIALAEIILKVPNFLDKIILSTSVLDLIYVDTTRTKIRNSIDIEKLDLTIISGFLRNLPKSPTGHSDLRNLHYKECANHTGHSKCCSNCDHVCKTCGAQKCKQNKCCMSSKHTNCNHPCRNTSCATNYAKCRDRSTICCDQCGYCSNCKASMAIAVCPNEELRNSGHSINALRNLVSHLTFDHCQSLRNGSFNHPDFPNCKTVGDLLDTVGNYVAIIVKYLYNKGEIDSACHDEFNTEINEIKSRLKPSLIQLNSTLIMSQVNTEVTIKESIEVQKELIKKQESLLDMQQDYINNQKCVTKVEFGFKITNENLTDDENPDWCIFGKAFQEHHESIDGELSKSVERSVLRVLEENTGTNDIRNFAVSITKCEFSTCKVWFNSPIIKFEVMVTDKDDQILPDVYSHKNSEESREIRKKLMKMIIATAKLELLLDIKLRFTEWKPGSVIIRGILQKASGDLWMDTEEVVVFNILKRSAEDCFKSFNVTVLKLLHEIVLEDTLEFQFQIDIFNKSCVADLREILPFIKQLTLRSLSGIYFLFCPKKVLIENL